ncbi:MAG: hypothetical protein EOP53_26770, partial [Sphingobacteriales bacterium]
RYITAGELDIHDFMPKEKLDKIVSAIDEIGDNGLGPIKGFLGDDFSYGELRMAMAYYKRS